MSWLRVSLAAARDATGGRSAPVRRAHRAIASWSQFPLAAGFVVADESRRRDHSRGRSAAGGVANARSAGGGDGRVPAAAALAVVLAGMASPFVSEGVCVLAGMPLITQVRLPAHGGRGRSARVRDEIREGVELAVGARRGTDAGDHDLHLQRHLRRRLVGAGSLRA